MAQLPEGDAPFLDHVGHFVPDLDAAGEALEAAGFALTPRTRQRNLTDAGLVPSGTSNRCVMLEAGYVEVLAATDDTPLARQLEAALARRTGLHLLAFSVADAEAAHRRLAEGGFAPLEPVDLRRPVEAADGSSAEARFTVVRVAPETMPEGRVQLLRHRTPELLWQPRRLAHANAVVSLEGALVRVADPDEAAARFARFTGARVERRGERRVLALGRGALCFVASGALGEVAPALGRGADGAVPEIVASALGSRDRALTDERFRAAGIEPLGGGPGAERTYRFPASIGASVTVVAPGSPPGWLA